MKDASELQNLVVYEDDMFHASHEINQENESTYLGAVLIQTKRHVPDLSELTEEEAQRLGILVTRISKALKIATSASWTYSYLFLEGYRHVHYVIRSRYPSLPKEYFRLDLVKWPDAPKGSRAQVEELASKLRSYITSVRG